MKTFVLMMVSLLFAISSEAQNKSFYDFTSFNSQIRHFTPQSFRFIYS